MQLTFESLAELQDFVQWVQTARQVAPIHVSEVARDELVKAIEAEVPGKLQVLETPSDEQIEGKSARKRRTKAEMEAARAAETGSGETSAATAAAQQPATSDTTSAAAAVEAADSPAVAVGDAPAVKTEAVDKGDSAEFIKSRLAERPEVSQVEHLNLARTFIGKHGMEKYNASFPLAGLTPNVMGYSPADCATHAAALDFLSLE